MNLDDYYQMIETVISSMGVAVKDARGRRQGQWNLNKGDVRVWIDLWMLEDDERIYFQVMSPVRRLPARHESLDFMEKLLTVNNELYGAAFTIRDGWAWLKTIRLVDGMDQKGAERIIRRLGFYGNKYQKHLREVFGPEPNKPVHHREEE